MVRAEEHRERRGSGFAMANHEHPTARRGVQNLRQCVGGSGEVVGRRAGSPFPTPGGGTGVNLADAAFTAQSVGERPCLGTPGICQPGSARAGEGAGVVAVRVPVPGE